MTRLPRVDIVIPTIGRERLELAIVSALAQTYPKARPVVLSDGPNAAWEIVKPYLGRRGLMFVETEQREGFWGAAVRELWNDTPWAAPYIKILDDDDILRPHCVELMMAPILADPNVKVTYCHTLATVWSGNKPLRERTHGESFAQNEVGHGSLLYARELAVGVKYRRSQRSVDWDWIAKMTAGLEASQIVSVPHVLYVVDDRHGDNYNKFHAEGLA